MPTMNRKQRRHLANPPPKASALERAREVERFVEGVITATEINVARERADVVLSIRGLVKATMIHGVANPGTRDAFCKLIGRQIAALENAHRRTDFDLVALRIALDEARAEVARLSFAPAADTAEGGAHG